MIPIIHKAAVDLEINPSEFGISPGDQAFLLLHAEKTISVFVQRPTRFPFLFRMPRDVLVGTLAGWATEMMLPAIEREAVFRVRIIEIEPAHISRTGRASVYVSVWGNPVDFVRPKRTSLIFTRSKINDPVLPQNKEG